NFRELQLHRGDLLKVSAVAFDDDGRLLATATMSGVLTIWDTGNQRVVFGAMRGRGGSPIPGLAFLPKDPSRRIVYARGPDIVFEKWQESGRQAAQTIRTQKAIRAAAFDPAGEFVSVTDEDSLGIWEYGVSRGKWSLKLPSNRPACLALSG